MVNMDHLCIYSSWFTQFLSSYKVIELKKMLFCHEVVSGFKLNLVFCVCWSAEPHTCSVCFA